MGMLFKTPKYQRPPQMDATNKALEERERRAAAEESKQIRSLANRRRAIRQGGLLINEANLDLLGKAPVQEQSVRDPMERFR